MFRKLLTTFLIIMLIVMLGAATTAQDDMETYVLGVALPFSGNLGNFGQTSPAVLNSPSARSTPS